MSEAKKGQHFEGKVFLTVQDADGKLHKMQTGGQPLEAFGDLDGAVSE